MAKQAYVFNAKLDRWQGVRRTIAVRADQTLADLHDALQAAFDWDNDHLYAFWLDGKFWSRDGTEYVHPFGLEGDPFAGWDLPVSKPRSASLSIGRSSGICSCGVLFWCIRGRSYRFEFFRPGFPFTPPTSISVKEWLCREQSSRRVF